MRKLCGILALILLSLSTARAQEETPFQLMGDKRYKAFKAMLPKVSDQDVQKIFDDPSTLLYTDDEIPRAHQDWEGALQGLHSPWYNILVWSHFDPGSISHGGTYVSIKMNAAMTKAGVIAQYNAKSHPEAIYRRISELK